MCGYEREIPAVNSAKIPKRFYKDARSGEEMCVEVPDEPMVFNEQAYALLYFKERRDVPPTLRPESGPLV